MMQKRINKTYKKGRNSLLAKQTKEEYLRADLSCFSLRCESCLNAKDDLLLEKEATCYLIPDYETLEKYSEILTNRKQGLKNTIFLFSILEQLLENGKIEIVNKIYKFVLNTNNIIFMDKHCLPIVEQTPANISNEEKLHKMVIRSSEYYSDHLNTEVVIISENEYYDRTNNDKIKTITFVEYMSNHSNHEMKSLMNSLLLNSNTKTSITKRIKYTNSQSNVNHPEYEEYENYTQLNSENEYYKGILLIQSSDNLKGYVSINKTNKICINGKTNLNRALDGDRVVVKLCETATNASLDEEFEEEDDYLNLKSTTNIIYGKIVAIVERKDHTFVATLHQELKTMDIKGTKHHLFVPIDYKYPVVYVDLHDQNIPKIKNSRVILKFVGWDKPSDYHPICTVLSVVGPLYDIYTDLHSMLVSSDVSVDQINNHFDQESLNSIYKIENIDNWSPELHDLDNRIDLRESHVVFSIDPEGCQDIDDALSIRLINDQKFEIGVHIADVTSFFKYGSHLDLEARQRATSIYLPHKRFDMLPTVLSANLCSLHPNVDRLALSVFWIVDEEGNIIEQEIKETIIKSKYKFSYEEAEEMLKDLEGKKYKEHIDIIKSMKLITDIMTHIRNRRLSKGAIEILSGECEIDLNSISDTQNEIIVDSVVENMETSQEPLLLDIHKVIEEAMVLANTTIATYCFSKNSIDPDNFKDEPCVLLRNHPLPKAEKLVKLEGFASSIGMELDFSSIKSVSESLNKLSKYKDETKGLKREQLVKSLSVFAMEEAKYLPAQNNKQMVPADVFRHFGLALDFYTHFTSPIRRYSDIIVHHLVKAKMYNTNFNITYNEMEKITKNINQKTRLSKAVARVSAEMILNYYVLKKEKIGELVVCESYVTRVSSSKIHVFIPKYQVKSVLSLNKDSIYETMFFDDKENTSQLLLENKKIKKTFSEEEQIINISYLDKTVQIKEYDSILVELHSQSNVYHYTSLQTFALKKVMLHSKNNTSSHSKKARSNLDWINDFNSSKNEKFLTDTLDRFYKEENNRQNTKNQQSSIFDDFHSYLIN